MGKQKQTAKQTFIRAYDIIFCMKDLNSTEKLVLIVLCRYWPNPYWGTNEGIAEFLGFSKRYIEKIIRSLVAKKKIMRGFAHREEKGQPKTFRVIVPQCLPGRCKLDVSVVKTERMDGQQPEQSDGQTPNSCSLSPEQMDDLLEKNKKINKKKMPAPLPAGGQASAFFKKTRGTPPTAQEIEKRRQEQIRALRES